MTCGISWRPSFVIELPTEWSIGELITRRFTIDETGSVNQNVLNVDPGCRLLCAHFIIANIRNQYRLPTLSHFWYQVP